MNDVIGSLAACSFPAPYLAFKYIHLLHHKFTNDKDKDPDYYTAKGPTWLLPFRWATIEVHYYSIYLPVLFFHRTRPRFESIVVIIHILAILILLIFCYFKGYGETLLYAWIIPGRCANMILALFFGKYVIIYIYIYIENN